MPSVYTIVDMPDGTTELYAGRCADVLSYCGTAQNPRERADILRDCKLHGDTVLIADERDAYGTVAA